MPELAEILEGIRTDLAAREEAAATREAQAEANAEAMRQKLDEALERMTALENRAAEVAGSAESTRDADGDGGSRMGEDDDHKDDEDMDRGGAEAQNRERQGNAGDRGGPPPSGRSNGFNPNTIIPDPAKTLHRDGTDGMRLDNLVQGYLSSISTPAEMRRQGDYRKIGNREMEWVSENTVSGGPARGLVVPFEFFRLAAPPNSRTGQIMAARARQQQAHERAIAVGGGTGSGSGVIGTTVDVPHSAGWLADMAPVLGYLEVITGYVGEYKAYYGDTAKRPDPVFAAEGATITKRDPALKSFDLLPKTMWTTFDITSEQMAVQSGIAPLAVMEAEKLVTEGLTHGVCSGPNVGDGNAADTNSPTGLWNISGIGSTNYGAAPADFAREDVVGVRQQLKTNLANGNPDRLFWLLSIGLETLAINTPIGASDDTIAKYVLQNKMMEDGEGTPIVSTTLLHGGSGGGAAVNPGMLLYGDKVVVVIWGNGIEMRTFSPPDAATVQFGWGVHWNMNVVEPLNLHKIKQG